MAQRQRVYLARHGETEWSRSGRHTGRTDVPLTANGETEAQALGERLRGIAPALVVVSPLQRARRTCEIAGFGARAQVEPDAIEWNYGEYEGKRSVEIYAARPNWNLFRDGCPAGETADEVGARADRVIARMRAQEGDALLFSHGHFLRVFAARWLGLPADGARLFVLSTAAMCILGYEHERVDEPAVLLWNAVR